MWKTDSTNTMGLGYQVGKINYTLEISTQEGTSKYFFWPFHILRIEESWGFLLICISFLKSFPAHKSETYIVQEQENNLG